MQLRLNGTARQPHVATCNVIMYHMLLIQENQKKIITATNENIPLAHASPIPYTLKLATLMKNISSLVTVRLLKSHECVVNTIDSVW